MNTHSQTPECENLKEIQRIVNESISHSKSKKTWAFGEVPASLENKWQVSLLKMENKLTNKITSVKDTLKALFKPEGIQIPKQHKRIPHD